MMRTSFSAVAIAGCLFLLLGTGSLQPAQAQVEGAQQVKWLSVGSIQQWFSSGGAEIEYGRRGRGQYLNTDQIDGLGWPAEYANRVYTNVGKSLWIGTTNFDDPVAGRNFPYKVVSAGRRFMYLGTEIFPAQMSLVGKTNHPGVTVDDADASDRSFDDDLDAVDPSLPADRAIVNVFHTPIGITVTRRVLAFTQQYHDNYFIYEYTFKNTGIINSSGGTLSPARTLHGVVFHWQYRYAVCAEPYRAGWPLTGTNWGLNTINDCVGQHPGAANWDGTPYEFRAIWAWYGPHSASQGWTENVGFPNTNTGYTLGGSQYVGVVVLHADKSATDHSDDPNQPTTTTFNGADQGGSAQTNNQFDAALMERKYALMTAGHPTQTHAQAVGRTFADKWGGDAGGYQSAQGFGPYDIAPGDSVKIVVAEAIAGLNKDMCRTVARKWFNNAAPFTLPNGSTASDRNAWKEAWVFTGKDSLFQSFRRAIANYNSGYAIPQPPPAPASFSVASGGNKVTLTWASNADAAPGFNGYQVFRAEGRVDTNWTMIFSCDRGNVAHTYEDKSARRGFNYYYYIQTKDDGSNNPGNPTLGIPANAPLFSSKYLTMTNHEAFLTRPPGTRLDDIRIVPNPYNISAKQYQFGRDTPDRLAFYGLPAYCTIRIYTESGDLIQTIEHTSSSGDELWHSLTSSNQLVVSGLYIAYFEVSRDCLDDVGNVVFHKGEHTFRKFIVIR